MVSKHFVIIPGHVFRNCLLNAAHSNKAAAPKKAITGRPLAPSAASASQPQSAEAPGALGKSRAGGVTYPSRQ